MELEKTKRVNDLTGMAQICIDLKPNRCDSDVFINQKIVINNIKKRIIDLIEEGYLVGYKLEKDTLIKVDKNDN